MGFSLYYHLKKGDSYHMATDRGAGLDALASGDAPSPPLDMRRRLIAQVRSCLQDYRIYLAGSVVIGLSGGKDSTALLTLLPDLGVRVIPVIVDLGYSSFDAEGIAASAAQLGFRPIILCARASSTLPLIRQQARERFQSTLEALVAPEARTPCSMCSRIKRDILVAVAQQHQSRWILLGHHLHDFLTTILKDYFIERYYKSRQRYNARNFQEFIGKDNIDIESLRSMVERGAAATMGIRLAAAKSLWLVRPMAYISESDLKALVLEQGIPVFGSGCAHDVFQDPMVQPTKREFVHAELTVRIHRNPILASALLSVALSSLDESGRPVCNPRATRPERFPGFAED